MQKLKALFVVALALFVAAPAFAETQNVKVSGSIDSYAISRNNFDLLDNNDAGSVAVGSTLPGQSHSGTSTDRSETDNYFMTITQLEVSADLTDNVSTVVNLINQRDWNANDYATGGSLSANEFDILLDLAYVQMKEIFYSPLTLTIGRQDLLFGRGFIIGWNPQDPQGNIQAEEFTQIQSFDAIRATLDFNPWTLDFVYAKIDENGTNPEDDSDLYIANINYKFAEYNAVAEAYYVGQYDRATLSGSTGTNMNDTNTVGGRVQFDPISQITLGGELAYQFGNYSSTVGAVDRDRSAVGVDIFGEYRWDNTWKPMLGIEYVYLDGEEDLGAGSTQSYSSWNGAFRGSVYGWYHDYKETYFQTAQTNDQVAGQNQQHISIYGSIQPMEDLKLSVNFFHFWTVVDSHVIMTDPNSGTLSEEIGNEIDTMVTYNYTEDVTFNFMADWFIPGDLYNSPADEVASQYIGEVKVTF